MVLSTSFDHVTFRLLLLVFFMASLAALKPGVFSHQRAAQGAGRLHVRKEDRTLIRDVLDWRAADRSRLSVLGLTPGKQNKKTA